MTERKRIEVVFYQSEGGAMPVRDWLMQLPKEERGAIGTAIKTVEFGWPIGMPVCRSLSGGLYEVRTSLKNRISRVIFMIHGQDMVLLHAFIKKTAATPSHDLELARKRQREWRAQNGD